MDAVDAARTDRGHPRRRRAERAATLVEYTLIVAVFAVGTLGALNLLRSGASATASNTAADISSGPRVPTTTVPGGSGPAPTTTSASTTTSTTTPPATTAPPATVPPTQAISTWGPVSTQAAADPDRWKALTSTTIRNDNDQPVSGATVTIRIQTRIGAGSWTDVSPDLVGTTGPSGTLNLDSGFYNSSGATPPRADEIRFQVVSVTAPGLTWVSNGTQVGATKPN